MKSRLNKRLWIYSGICLILISIIWALKNIYFVIELELNPHKKFLLLGALGLSLILISFLLWNKSKLNLFFVSLLYILLSILLYADVIYERYYDAILHINLLGQAGQVGDVIDSVISLIYITDWLYFIDIPFILIVFYWLYTKNKKNLIKKTYVYWISVSLGLSIILFTSFYPLKTTYSDQYMVSLTGILPSHIYTLSQDLNYRGHAKEQKNIDPELLKEIKSEFAKNQALQKQSPYFGKFRGKNIIIVQAESLNTFPIELKVNGIEITPNINKLISISNYYPNTFLQIGRGNTSDAEFVANNSIYPMASKGIYNQYPHNDYLSLANILKKAGYRTMATHGNVPEFWNRGEAYKGQGYQTFFHINHPLINNEEIIGLGISDESIFSQMVKLYKKDRPFYNFIVTLTNHRPFELPKEYQFLDLPQEFEGTNTGNYLQSVHYFDYTIGKFIEQLKEADLWDETIFVLYGDHYGPLPKDKDEIKELLQIDFNEKTRFNIPLIIHHPNQTQGVVNNVIASQMDIYPTITSLLGIEENLIQFGQPLDVKKEGFVGFAYETTRYSFYSDKYDYIASHDGNFESGTCIDNKTNNKTNVKACSEGYNKIVKDIELSSFLLENNLIKSLTD